MLKHISLFQPKGDIYMELILKITSKGPLSEYNSGGESVLWTLFPLFRIYEVSAQIDMKEYWGNFANMWNSDFYFAFANCVVVKEERKIVKRLCYCKWYNYEPVLTIGMCKSSSVASKSTELLKWCSLIHETERNNVLLKAEENFVYLPSINDMRLYFCLKIKWCNCVSWKIVSYHCRIVRFYKSHAASHWFWR